MRPDPFVHVARCLADVKWMTPDQGRIVYDHLRRTGARDVLDIGTCFGASAGYLAAAVLANGGGRVTTVDSSQFDSVTPAKETVESNLAACGVRELVDIVRIPHSSYAWWLKEQVEARTDEAGNCSPAYDFVYLDGAKSLTIDGVSVVLIERLLRPGGWLLLDDLDWTFDYNPTAAQTDGVTYAMSPAERSEPHVRAVFELIVKGYPSFTQLRLMDGQWGWAQKQPDAPRRYSVEYSRPLGDVVMDRGRRLVRSLRTRRAGG